MHKHRIHVTLTLDVSNEWYSMISNPLDTFNTVTAIYHSLESGENNLQATIRSFEHLSSPDEDSLSP